MYMCLKRGVNTKVPYRETLSLHFIIIYGTVPITCSNFQIVHMKGLETSFPGKKIKFVAHLEAEIWPFEKNMGEHFS